MKLCIFKILLLVALGAPGLLGDEVICCGNREVWIHDIDTGTGERGARIWSWTQSDSPRLVEHLHKSAFRSPDECKPIRDGTAFLITSSGGGVAIVERETKRATFWANVRNAHSADLLPGGRILVAGSTGSDKIILFDEKTPKQILWSDRCRSAHGIVWDAKRQRVYALGFGQIQVYTLADWKTKSPSLTRIDTIKLPEGGGHDLFPDPASPRLLLSTGGRTWTFDRDTGKIAPHPVIADVGGVKSLNHHPVTGQLMFTRATIPGGSNTFQLELRKPDFTIRLDQKTYKARWNPERPAKPGP